MGVQQGASRAAIHQPVYVRAVLIDCTVGTIRLDPFECPRMVVLRLADLDEHEALVTQSIEFNEGAATIDHHLTPTWKATERRGGREVRLHEYRLSFDTLQRTNSGEYILWVYSAHQEFVDDPDSWIRVQIMLDFAEVGDGVWEFTVGNVPGDENTVDFTVPVPGFDPAYEGRTPLMPPPPPEPPGEPGQPLWTRLGREDGP